MQIRAILSVFTDPDKTLIIIIKKTYSVFLLLLLICVGGCGSWGGGGGIYFPPKVAKNTINLQKIELTKTGIVSYEKQFFPILYSQRHLRNRVREAGKKIFDDEGYFQEVKFNGADYYLYNSHYRKIYVIRKSDMKKILYLSAPRYFSVFSSFPIMMNNQNYLVIYVEQQATSHSSTLFLLDSKFKIVYQEHLLGAIAIGYTHSEKYGNCIVLKSEDFWFPDGIKKPKRVSINGNWLYYMKPERDKLK
jgi:hypothetical protein